MSHSSRDRHHPSVLALLAAVVATTAVALGVAVNPLHSSPAHAAPSDPEGGSAELRAALDTANRGYLDAKAALEHSQQRQRELSQEIARIEQQLGGLEKNADEIAKAAYRRGGLSNLSALADSGSPDAFLDRATALNVVAMRNDRQLRDLTATRRRLADARAATETEIANSQRQLDEMARRKQEAEKALANAGGGQPTAGPGGSSGGTATAKPAPRRANGSWPAESCSVDDPTTSSCLTPRMLHAYQQVRAAGFTHFTGCHRDGDNGEHPKGRACDFAAAVNTFGGVATGAERTYGNNLAAYCIKNADALAVLYVIWFRQIWMPSTGWRSYSGGNGDPASDHTNHLHLSVH